MTRHPGVEQNLPESMTEAKTNPPQSTGHVTHINEKIKKRSSNSLNLFVVNGAGNGI
jgi:hypothetical protein